MKTHIDRVFEETVAQVKKGKAEATRKATEAKKREEEAEEKWIEARKKKIAELVNEAQRNIGAMTGSHTGNEKFLKYLTALFEQKAHRHNEEGYVTKNYRHPKKQGEAMIIGGLERQENYFFLLSIASSEDEDAGSAVNIVLRTGKTGMFERKVDPKKSSVEVLVMGYSHDFRTGITQWHSCDLYENKKLDAALLVLTKPESTVQLLVRKFGPSDEWKEEEY